MKRWEKRKEKKTQPDCTNREIETIKELMEVDLTLGFVREQLLLLQVELGRLSMSITSHGEQLSSHTIPLTSEAAGGGGQGLA